MKKPGTTDIKTLGIIIRDERRKQKLTQQDLADTAGVSVRFLGDLERGKDSCEIAKVFSILQVLGISLQLRLPGDET